MRSTVGSSADDLLGGDVSAAEMPTAVELLEVVPISMSTPESKQGRASTANGLVDGFTGPKCEYTMYETTRMY